MPGDLTATLRLKADGNGFVGEIRRASGEVGKLGKHTGGTTKKTKDLSRATDAASSSFANIHKRAFAYGGALLGVVTAQQAVQGALRRSDAFTSVANSVRLATESAVEYAVVQQGLFDIAHRTRQPIEAIVDLYQKLSLSAMNWALPRSDCWLRLRAWVRRWW